LIRQQLCQLAPFFGFVIEPSPEVFDLFSELGTFPVPFGVEAVDCFAELVNFTL
jgi:hypothetical protein